MISFILTIICVIFLSIGKHLYKRWLNPIFLYIGSWAFIIYSYDLQLIIYNRVTNFTWLLIFFAFLSFLMGVLVIYLGRNALLSNDDAMNSKIYSDEAWSPTKESKYAKAILITAIIGLLVSIQHWYVLILEYGSIAMVFLNAGDIYDLRVGGEHLGKIPYIGLLSYVSVFLSAIYSAHRNRFTYLVIIPLIAVILADAASLARAGIFFAFVLFGITFTTARYFFKSKTGSRRFDNNKNIILATILIILIALGSVSLIRLIRNPFGDYKSSTTELRQLSRDGIISTSVYSYFSSPIAVLSGYLDHRTEPAILGENTFFPIYHNLNKFGADILLNPYPKGYFIPMWFNSATYIRDLDVDFGPLGVFLIPFLIGSLSTFFWYKLFSKGNLVYLSLYAFTSILVVFSVFYIGTRLSFWFFAFIFSILAINFLERDENQIKKNIENV